jgi:hypothetical protein
LSHHHGREKKEHYCKYGGYTLSKGENFNRPSTICRTYGAGWNTKSILRINPPEFSGGLKFEPELRGMGFVFHPRTIVPAYGAGRAGAEIGQKGAF